MTANINPQTGIAYGVVSMNSLESWVFEEFLLSGNNDSYDDALADFMASNPGVNDDEIEAWNEAYDADESVYSLAVDGMRLQASCLGGAYLVWVFESPHTTYASVCSPCVPNAGDLNNKHDTGIVCYDLPQEWYASSE